MIIFPRHFNLVPMILQRHTSSNQQTVWIHARTSSIYKSKENFASALYNARVYQVLWVFVGRLTKRRLFHHPQRVGKACRFSFIYIIYVEISAETAKLNLTGTLKVPLDLGALKFLRSLLKKFMRFRESSILQSSTSLKKKNLFKERFSRNFLGL